MKKIYTGYNERTNAHYFHNFQEIEELPKIGDFYDGRKVIEINELTLDCEQPCDDNFLFDAYEVVCEDEDAGTIECYVCTPKKMDDELKPCEFGRTDISEKAFFAYKYMCEKGYYFFSDECGNFYYSKNNNATSEGEDVQYMGFGMHQAEDCLEDLCAKVEIKHFPANIIVYNLNNTEQIVDYSTPLDFLPIEFDNSNEMACDIIAQCQKAGMLLFDDAKEEIESDCDVYFSDVIENEGE